MASSSNGIVGQKLSEETNRIIYSVIDQTNLICIQHKDHEDPPDTVYNCSNSRRSSIDNTARFQHLNIRSSPFETAGKGTWITSITSNVYEMLRDASIPVFFVAPHSQPDLFIAEKCSMVPLIWKIHRLSTSNNASIRRFSPPLIEIFFRENRLANDEFFNFSHSIEFQEATSIYSYEQLMQTDLNFERMKISPNELDFMFQVALTVFEILEHVWMTRKKCQLVSLRLEFGFTSGKELVLATIFDLNSWHFFRPNVKPNESNDETLRWICSSLREIIDDNSMISFPIEQNLDEQQTGLSKIDENESFRPETFEQSMKSRCVIICSSTNDIENGQKLRMMFNEIYHFLAEIRLCTIEQSSQTLCKFISTCSDEHWRTTVLVTLGMSNIGLATVLAANCSHPIIHCLCVDNNEQINQNLLPSDSCLFTTVSTLTSAVHNVIQILSIKDCRLWIKQRGRRLKKSLEFVLADQQLIHSPVLKSSNAFSFTKSIN